MFEVNRVALDWLTLTTFDATAAQAFMLYVADLPHGHKEGKRMQYAGRFAAHELGTAFCGAADQRGKAHVLLQVSGALAHNAYNVLRPHIVNGRCRVTRIDVQVTIPYDRSDWSQAAVFGVVRRARPDRSVSFAESQSGPAGSKLATVYYGSRTSERVTRLYEKPGMGEEVFLRFETEYKGGLARSLGLALAKGHESARNALAAEIAAFPHTGVQNHFRAHMDNPELVRSVSEAGNTKQWLLGQVLPALDRFLNDHDNAHGQDVADAFWRLLADHL